MANLHAAAAAAAQAQAAHQVVASTKAVQAAAVAAATPCTETINSTGASIAHPSASTHNASAVGQFLANPTPLPPLHSSTHHPIASHHHSHHMYFPGTPDPTHSTPTTLSASSVTALPSLV